MKLRPTSIALLVVAVVLAGSAALVARGLMHPAPPQKVVVEQPQPKPDPVLVLTAAEPITPGDFVDGTVVRWTKHAEEDVRPGEIVGRSAGDRRELERTLFGATVRQDITPGEPIPDNALIYPGSPGFIAAVLSAGMRAISIPTSAVTSNAGLVSAGDWVDVILSVERDEAAVMSADSGGLAQANLAAQTILRHVRVLALGNDTKSLAPVSVVNTDGKEVKGKDQKSKRSQRRREYETLTLEVTPDEAEQLAVAREAGSLQVVLRSVKDTEVAMAETGEDEKKKVTRLQDATAIFASDKKSKQTATVQTFLGNKVGAVSF